MSARDTDVRPSHGPREQQYDAAYYAHYYSGGDRVAYERNEQWLGFFGSVAARIAADIAPASALARLETPDQTRFDEYLDTEALDAVRGDPQTYQLIGRAAHSLADGGERCVTAAYWREDGADEVDVELEVADDEVCGDRPSPRCPPGRSATA